MRKIFKSAEMLPDLSWLVDISCRDRELPYQRVTLSSTGISILFALRNIVKICEIFKNG